MAAREGDTALWLHNKLGSTDDLWSGASICSQLTREKLLSIQDCFHNLQPYVKVKLMLAFLHLPKRNIEEWKIELEEILQLAIDDTDQWVAMVGDILRTYPSTGALNTDIDESARFYHEVLVDLKKLVKKSADVGMLPMECLYLSRNALQSVAGQQPQAIKHFALKRKPKSAALRAELLQKSVEAANNLKRGCTPTSIPIKVRSFAKKMDDTTPLKGIPNRIIPSSASSGFMRSSSIGSRFGGTSTPLGSRTPSSSRKEGGIKLLDITEQPVGAKEAKRRKKQAEMEAMEQQKKEKEQAVNTPDYAAGLMSPAVQNLNTVPASPGPSYVPSNATRMPGAVTGGTTTLPTNSLSAATQQARENLQQQLQQQLGQQPQPKTAGAAAPPVGQPAAPAAAQNITPVPNAAVQQAQPPPAGPKKGLSLTREQMLEAQEMFRTSNKVTRPEKALILGFMAGSRDNPCPQQGHIVNIRLSETTDTIQQPDGLFKPMVVDTYFQMNYNTGEWKRIKKFREPDEEEV